MPLVCIYETSDLQKAFIIRSTLEAYGIHVTLAGIELAQQVPLFLPPSLSTVGIMVSDVDGESARLLIQQAERGPVEDVKGKGENS